MWKTQPALRSRALKWDGENKSGRVLAQILLLFFTLGPSSPVAMPASSGRTPATPRRDGGAVDQAGRGLFRLEGRAGRGSKEGGAATKPAEEVDRARQPGIAFP